MKKSLWVICVLLVILLAGLMFAEEKMKNEKTTQIESVNQNSAYYEEKLSSLKAELEEKRAAYKQSEENGFICIAAKVSSASQLNTLYSWLDEYEFPLTVIIDTSASSSTVSPILRAAAAHTNSSIMYCGSTYNWAENTEDMDSLLSQNNFSHCGIAYFDYAASYSQIAAAQSSGMRGYSNPFTSANDFNTEMKDNDISSIGHFLFSDTANVSEAVTIASDECKIFILSIDMDALDVSFTANSVNQAFKTIDSYVQNGTLQAVSMDEYMEHFDEGYKERQAAKAEFEAYETQTLAEIAQLETSLKEMYAIIE